VPRTNVRQVGTLHALASHINYGVGVAGSTVGGGSVALVVASVGVGAAVVGAGAVVAGGGVGLLVVGTGAGLLVVGALVGATGLADGFAVVLLAAGATSVVVVPVPQVTVYTAGLDVVTAGLVTTSFT